MKQKELTYIKWHNEPQWVANVTLGDKNSYYQFSANWNNRSDAWYITIKQDEDIIIQGVKLVLDVNLIAMASSRNTPSCMLAPFADNNRIKRISFENMINEDVKLYHILTKE